MNYVIFDIETTGLDPFTHRIMGYGIYKNEKIIVEIDENERKLIKKIFGAKFQIILSLVLTLKILICIF